MKFFFFKVEDRGKNAWKNEYRFFVEAEDVSAAREKARQKIEALKIEDEENYRFYTLHEDTCEEVADGLFYLVF